MSGEYDRMVSVQEAADIIGVDVVTVYRWRRGRHRPEGLPDSQLVDGKIRYSRNELVRWVVERDAP